MVDALRLSTLQLQLFMHGADDPLIPVECGQDIAAHIPGAELRILDGMAHDFPLPLIDTFADAIAGIARRGMPR